MIAQRRRNYRKYIWWGAGLVLILLVVGIVIGVNSSNGADNPGDSSEMVEQKDESNQDEKIEQEKKDEEVANQQKVKQYEGEDPNQAEELSGVVTYAGVNDDVLMIRTSIDQYLTEGSCNLTLVRGSDIIYGDTTNIVGDVSTASCEGFDVPVAVLGGGNIKILIVLNADGRVGSISGEVNIE